MHPARAVVDILDDLLRSEDIDVLVLKFVGLGLSAGVILMAVGLWLAGKAGI